MDLGSLMDNSCPLNNGIQFFFTGIEKHINTAVWVRLPQLPTEFYDEIILQKIGNSIGKLLKVDACTSATLRGRYARLCVELPLENPVQPCILIGSHPQQLSYEGKRFLQKMWPTRVH